MVLGILFGSFAIFLLLNVPVNSGIKMTHYQRI